jgi:hypothetical protein
MKIAWVTFVMFISLVGCAQKRVMTDYERVCEGTKHWGLTAEELRQITTCPVEE